MHNLSHQCQKRYMWNTSFFFLFKWGFQDLIAILIKQYQYFHSTHYLYHFILLCIKFSKKIENFFIQICYLEEVCFYKEEHKNEKLLLHVWFSLNKKECNSFCTIPKSAFLILFYIKWPCEIFFRHYIFCFSNQCWCILDDRNPVFNYHKALVFQLMLPHTHTHTHAMSLFVLLAADETQDTHWSMKVFRERRPGRKSRKMKAQLCMASKTAKNTGINSSGEDIANQKQTVVTPQCNLKICWDHDGTPNQKYHWHRKHPVFGPLKLNYCI